MATVPVRAEGGIGQWTPTYDNQPRWYSFRVGGTGDALQNYVSIRAYSKPAGAATFQVFSGGDWQMWDTIENDDWMGAGSAENREPQAWAGELASGEYFIRMLPTGADDVLISVTGQGVNRTKSWDRVPVSDFFVMQQPDFVVDQPAVVEQQPAVAQQRPVAPVSPVATTATAATFTFAETQPVDLDHAEMEMVPGQWMDVFDNEPMWFTFHVGRPQDGAGTSHVAVSLFATPYGGGEFQIFSAEGANSWVKPVEGDWFGAGAITDFGTNRWAGDLVPGAYYVRVAAGGLRTCLLAVTGENIRY
jgi:hypothetical protein